MTLRRHHGGSSAGPARRDAKVRPRLVPLEDRAMPSTTLADPPVPPTATTPPPAVVTPYLAFGADVGNAPYVTVRDLATGQTRFSLFAYESTYRGGVRVATGDINGDGVPELVTGPGPGRAPLVRVYDGTTGTLVNQFMAYDEKFKGGVHVAVGDVNGDGYGDIVTGAADGGGPHVRVFNGAWVIPPILIATPPAPTTPTAGADDEPAAVVEDPTGDPTTTNETPGDPTTPTETGDPTDVEEMPSLPVEPVIEPPPIDTTTMVLTEFMAYDERFRGGARVALGDVTGDGVLDIITGPGNGGGPHVRIFDGTTGQVYREFMAFGSTFTGGIYVSAGDVDGDGRAELAVSTGVNGGGRVKVYSGATGNMLRQFGVAGGTRSSAIRVRMVDYDNDGLAELLTAAGQRVQVRDPRTNAIDQSFAPFNNGFQNGLNLG